VDAFKDYRELYECINGAKLEKLLRNNSEQPLQLFVAPGQVIYPNGYEGDSHRKQVGGWWC